jgi:putative transposase
MRIAPKFKNKYRIESARLKNWDYSANGAYFLTICTKNRERILGKVVCGETVLSDIGKIVAAEWATSFQIRAELFGDEFCILPNHIHGIVFINKPENTVVVVETHGRASLPRRPKSISSFIAGFKSAATKKINEFRNSPGVPVWQSRFHDHIIRDQDALQRIRRYIRENPQNWKEDENFGTRGM